MLRRSQLFLPGIGCKALTEGLTICTANVGAEPLGPRRTDRRQRHMNTSSLSNLSALKLALLAREARATSQAALNADPIAIVGMACRTPGGGDTPDALWRLLKAGIDTTSEVPTDRWDGLSWFDPDPSAPGKSVTCRGAFLSQVDEFDADYFGILRREAEGMDPQQRLMLEVAIEAIDDAGIPHSTLMHARAAVFAASYHYDYARLVYDDIDAIDLRSLTGVAQSIIANRVSHYLDLRGPSVAIDSGLFSLADGGSLGMPEPQIR